MTEQTGPDDELGNGPLSNDPLTGLEFDAWGNLIDLIQSPEVMMFGPPPAVGWLDPLDLPTVFGRRCALANRDQITYDLRCASEVYQSAGGQYLNVVSEDQWYRWHEMSPQTRPERVPRATSIATKHLWIEDTTQPTPGGQDDAPF